MEDNNSNLNTSELPNQGFQHSPQVTNVTEQSSMSPNPPIESKNQTNVSSNVAPQAVVKVLSPRGVEYVFMTITLFTVMSGMVSVLIALVNGKTDFNVLEFPIAMLVISMPVFAWLFLHLKKAELNESNLKLDPSKRRSTQFIQIVNFIVCLFTLIGLLTAIFAKMSGQYSGGSIIKIILDALVILVVVGGVLFYYWRDEHRS